MYNFEESPIVSAYESYNSPIPNKQVNLLKSLTTDRYKDEVERYRNSNDVSTRRAIKSGLPCMTVSGIFALRSESDIVKHSGYICLDIDGKDQDGREIDWDEMKKLIGELFDCVYFVGRSIGGDGIFVIAKVRNPMYHKMHYRALAKEISSATGLKMDMSCCDVARLRGATYDPAPYYNPNPAPYNRVMVREPKSTKNAGKTQTERNRKNVEDAIKLICAHKIDITGKYKVWFSIAVALYDEFGEDGRKYFHLVSSIFEYYNEEDCDRQYDKCVSWGTDIRLETFFHHCKMHGIVRRKEGMVYDPSIIPNE